MKRVVRIRKVWLKNFKNTAYGEVEIPETEQGAPFDYHSGILGIYGQNGSGKTAVIEALAIIKRLLSGNSLRQLPINDYIMSGCENCTLGVRFSIEREDENGYLKIYTDYEVCFARSEAELGEICSELLKAEKNDNGKPFRRTLIDYDTARDVDCFSPKYRYQALAKTKEKEVAVSVAQRMAKKEQESFIFSKEGLGALAGLSFSDFDCGRIVDDLNRYANDSLFVIPNAHSALISLGENTLLNVRLAKGSWAIAGAIPFLVRGPEVVHEEYYELLSRLLDTFNSVLKEIIPGLAIKIHSFGREMLRDGEEGIRIELVSQRGDSVIPIRYESEGIIKVISILNVLICVYADASVCLAIDELDSGIFEYLLGELLIVLNNYGKGQMIFTSHNLRPLEMLDKTNIIFSTTNPANRYIHMQYVKQNNNMRDMYLRSIMLGGQKEELYAETDTNGIARVLRRAGKVIYGGESD